MMKKMTENKKNTLKELIKQLYTGASLQKIRERWIFHLGIARAFGNSHCSVGRRWKGGVEGAVTFTRK